MSRDNRMKSSEFIALCKEKRNEHEEQKEVVEYLRTQKILFYAVPNGGKRHIKTALNLKEEGVVAGVPDLCICEPNKYYHGLYIEMKQRPKTLKSGKKSYRGISASDTQRVWHQELRHRNYACVVACGADEAIKVIEKYMENVQ